MHYCCICDRLIDTDTAIAVNGGLWAHPGACREEWIRKELVLDEIFATLTLPDIQTESS